MQKILYLIIAFTVGSLFNRWHVPAGWLLGSLVTGIIYSFYIKKLYFPNDLFKVSLAIVGANIGFMVIPSQFLTYQSLIVPFIIVLILTLTGGILLGKFMQKFSNVHPNTAFFCCLPGGASEVIALSKDYGADQQIVAAFHTTRITLFVLVIPLIVGLNTPVTNQVAEGVGVSVSGAVAAILCVGIIGVISLFIGDRIPIPGASLLIAIMVGFIAHQWVVPTVEIPSFVTGLAQALMGAIIGIRFDRETYSELKRVGKVALLTLAIYFTMSIGLALFFFVFTPLDFFSSLLSIVPAGAAEMSSTAAALGIEPTLVATLQMLRVLILFALLPLLIKWFSKPATNKERSGSV